MNQHVHVNGHQENGIQKGELKELKVRAHAGTKTSFD
jgi:hypothetical protein